MPTSPEGWAILLLVSIGVLSVSWLAYDIGRVCLTDGRSRRH